MSERAELERRLVEAATERRRRAGAYYSVPMDNDFIERNELERADGELVRAALALADALWDEQRRRRAALDEQFLHHWNASMEAMRNRQFNAEQYHNMMMNNIQYRKGLALGRYTDESVEFRRRLMEAER